MRPRSIPIYLIPFLATTSLAMNHPVPRSVSIELIDSATAVHPGTTPAPQPAHLDLGQELAPHVQHLDLRQAVAPAAQPVAKPAAQPAAVPPAAAPVAPVAPVAPAAPAAPVAGVGGGGQAAAQPAPGAVANPVTTIMVNTVVGGVTTQVAVPYTQSFGAAASIPSVPSGSIGLGTLTGQVGVVKTQNAKSDAVRPGATGLLMEMVAMTVLGGVLAIGGGIWGLLGLI